MRGFYILVILLMVSFIHTQEALIVSEPKDTVLVKYFKDVEKPVKRIFQFTVPKPGNVVLGVSEDGDIYPIFFERIPVRARKPGTTYHVLGQTILGFSVYSWSLPTALSLSGRSAGVVGLLTPFGFFTYGMLTSKFKSFPEALGGFFGGVTGAFHGYLLLDDIKGVFPVSLSENILDQYLAKRLKVSSAVVLRKALNSGNAFYEANMLSNVILDRGLQDKEWRIATLYSMVKGYGIMYLDKDDNTATEGDVIFEGKLQLLGAEFLPLILYDQDLGRLKAFASLTGYIPMYIYSRKLSKKYDLGFGESLVILFSPALASSLVGGIAILINNETLTKQLPRLYPIVDLALTYYLYNRFKN
uniref:Uncharacterized protein n=1 Tax=candidate division WOR-3 bacterium TaxID=2052148 RepID=A0A7V3ZWI7_UNCW3